MSIVLEHRNLVGFAITCPVFTSWLAQYTRAREATHFAHTYLSLINCADLETSRGRITFIIHCRTHDSKFQQSPRRRFCWHLSLQRFYWCLHFFFLKTRENLISEKLHTLSPNLSHLTLPLGGESSTWRYCFAFTKLIHATWSDMMTNTKSTEVYALIWAYHSK